MSVSSVFMVEEGYALPSVRKVLTQASFPGGKEVDLSGVLGRSFLPQRGRDAEGAEIELTVRSSLRGNELAAEQSF